jgi:hypothetical protein
MAMRPYFAAPPFREGGEVYPAPSRFSASSACRTA